MKTEKRDGDDARADCERPRRAAGSLADLQAHDRASAAPAAGAEKIIPEAFAPRLLDGEPPLRVYRDLRGLTLAALAEKAGLNRVTVAEIETGRKQGSVAALRALGVMVDDLVG